jgi:regulator of RNase E activity RraA
MSRPDRAKLLEAFATVRVADVRDGMDTLLMHGKGSMSPGIRPLWRTRAAGIARTVRYVAFDGAVPELTPQEYWEWVGMYYRDVCPYPWMQEIEPGDFVVIDQSGIDAGLMGSENTLGGIRRGARPVTVGGVLVNPGDVVVADGDGVIVVPAEHALDVAQYADEEHRRDMVHRRKHYDDLGMEPDATVAG